MRLFVDGPTVEISRALTPDVIADADRWAKTELQPILDRAMEAYGAGSGPISGERAGQLLESCIRTTTDYLTARARGYANLRWLWLLRRLPISTFEGDYSTSQGYDATLAEVIAGTGTGKSRVRTSEDVRAYPCDATVIRRLARFCSGVRWLSNLHRDYRCAGKDISFEFRRRQIPRRLPDEAVWKSIELYDTRVERSGGVGRMGTEVFEHGGSAIDLRAALRTFDETDPLKMIFRVVSLPQTIEMPAPAPDVDMSAPNAAQVLVPARYLILPVPLTSLAALVARQPATGRPVLDASAAALLFLLFASTTYLGNHRAGFVGVLSTAYLQSDERFLRRQLGEAFPHTPEPIKTILEITDVRDADQVMQLVGRMSGKPWPLEPGPVLYRDGGAIALDLLNAGRRLADAVVFPRDTGGLANTRAGHFEIRVQESINRSSYRPPEEVLKLRGRTLKFDGLDVTDLDAIAQLDSNTLLLVSCKSIIYSPEYDAGEHRAVRNAAATVRKAQQAWN